MSSVTEQIIVLHGAVPKGAPPDEQDVLVEVEAVSSALERLGHSVEILPLTSDLYAARLRLSAKRPALVFNLVESIEGRGRLVHLAPTLLEELGLPYTGVTLEGLFLSSNKRLAKRQLGMAGIATPELWAGSPVKKSPQPPFDKGGFNDFPPSGKGGFNNFPPFIKGGRGGISAHGSWIVKSVWEHASIGLNDDSVIEAGKVDAVLAERRQRHGGEWFAEQFITGREFNLALLEERDGPRALPPAEIRFVDFPSGKPRIVGYDAKWNAGSFEYRHTRRAFDFPASDTPLLKRLEEIALQCWDLFDCRGYARVDFRVDEQNRPWVLEINANPCLSPDAGFVAAATRAGLPYDTVIERIIADALPPSPLVGEGRGEGDKQSRRCAAYPSSQPSPTRGEGVAETRVDLPPEVSSSIRKIV